MTTQFRTVLLPSRAVPTEEEEAYFHALQAEQREKLRRKLEREAAEVAKLRETAEASGTADLALAERIRKLGFEGRAAEVLDLLPLVAVAWADGKIQRGERTAILGALERRGIRRDHPGFQLLEALLEERPGETYFGEALAVLRDLVAERGADLSVPELCVEVARRSGGILGTGIGNTIDPNERAVLEEIAEAFGPEGARRIRAALERD
ncbi:MAG: hypothetical protein D6705_01570 [Deltaproteobacteria bacterium]|nr:MAG: hypothetical protein D6705_01570 [Deltaproteobacteria bacterium]